MKKRRFYPKTGTQPERYHCLWKALLHFSTSFWIICNLWIVVFRATDKKAISSSCFLLQSFSEESLSSKYSELNHMSEIKHKTEVTWREQKQKNSILRQEMPPLCTGLTDGWRPEYVSYVDNSRWMNSWEQDRENWNQPTLWHLCWGQSQCTVTGNEGTYVWARPNAPHRSSCLLGHLKGYLCLCSGCHGSWLKNITLLPLPA